MTSPGRRSNPHETFFEKRRRWSEYKHEILNKYLHVWTYKLGSRHKLLSFVDTCAGAGIYEDGVLGSPVIAAQWNSDPVMRERGTSLVVHACEANARLAQTLRAALAPWTDLDPPLAFVYQEPFQEAIPRILQATPLACSRFGVAPPRPWMQGGRQGTRDSWSSVKR